MKALPIYNSPPRGSARIKLYRSREDRGESAAGWNSHLRGPLIATQRGNSSLGNFGHSGPRKMLWHGANRKYHGAGVRSVLRRSSDGRSLNHPPLRGSWPARSLSKVANRSVSSQRSRGLTSRSFLPYRVGRGAFYVSFRRVSNTTEVYDRFDWRGLT